jgi:hypothetical protein
MSFIFFAIFWFGLNWEKLKIQEYTGTHSICHQRDDIIPAHAASEKLYSTIVRKTGVKKSRKLLVFL